MHLRDIRAKKQVTLGEGELDYAGLAALVRKTGWPGWLTVEEENLSKSLEGAKLEARLEADRRAYPQVLWRVSSSLFIPRSTATACGRAWP